MKSVSASIIVLSAAVLYTNPDFDVFAKTFSCVLGLVGIISWYNAFNSSD